MGLIHPEGIYDDPNGHLMREEVYPRLKYHFQFINEVKLFAEVHNQTLFSINVYSGKNDIINFFSINNLFVPETIYGCFIHDGSGICGGYKIRLNDNGPLTWNIKPHSSRLLNIKKESLEIISKAFEESREFRSVKLVSFHSMECLIVIKKISAWKSRIGNIDNYITVGWDETNAVNEGNILQGYFLPNIGDYEFLANGPMLYVSNPLYKSPRSTQRSNKDYDVLSHIQGFDSLQSTSFQTSEKLQEELRNIDKKSKIGKWLNGYKSAFRKMIPLTGERTLSGAILPPKAIHTNGLISVSFHELRNLIEFSALSSSIVFDFVIKTIGASNLTESRLVSLPIGVEEKYSMSLFTRTLQLNCLNKYYASLWEESWREEFRDDSWSKQDKRLKLFNTLTPNWQWNNPLRNWYERRQALVEIDVITAMALSLTLEELILIYNVQFPVLQQNEDDTWYDTKGNIVFTCSKGLVGVGLDRKEWEQVRNLPAGETYEHTITKSELYQGKKIIYHAPFDKCDRVEDYKVAWAHFEEVFKEEKG
jgi:hypothetical protein